MYVYICQDNLESVFTAVYRIYEEKHNWPDTKILLDWEPILFAEYIYVETDMEKAEKVIRTVRREFGEQDTHHLFMALSTTSKNKAEAVYKTIAYGLEHKVRPNHLFDNLADRNILLTNQLGQYASRECQHLKGFTRFRELVNRVLFAVITPKNHILPELMEHFSDRFPSENFMILDKGRKLFGIHKRGANWFLANADDAEEQINNVTVTEGEVAYSELFQQFCKTIAIKERKNICLQRNMLPLRFRPYMTEFWEECDKNI